jgi:hypothetical protein
MSRKYHPIWSALKSPTTNHTCALMAHSSLHARIIKAVIKEKWMDDGFKLLASSQRKSYKLVHSVSGKRLEFRLIEYTNLQNLNSQEL